MDHYLSSSKAQNTVRAQKNRIPPHILTSCCFGATFIFHFPFPFLFLIATVRRCFYNEQIKSENRKKKTIKEITPRQYPFDKNTYWENPQVLNVQK